MRDYRKRIKGLLEECLHLFFKNQLEKTDIADAWKMGLKAFVDSEYPKHKPNYLYIHSFLEKHDENEFVIDGLDVTGMYALFNYYPPVKAFIFDAEEETKGKLINGVERIREARNTLEHYKEEIMEEEKEQFLMDQVTSLSSVSYFASLVRGRISNDENWNRILLGCYDIGNELCYEKRIAIYKGEETLSFSDDDVEGVELSAKLGDVDSMVKMGKAYYYGDRVHRDEDLAFAYFLKATKKGNHEAEYYLSHCYGKTLFDYFDYNVKRKLLCAAAEGGHVLAMQELGVEYMFEKGKEEEAFALLTKAYDAGNVDAMWNLAICYRCGIGTSPNEEKYYALLEKASERGLLRATEELAKDSENKRDFAKAISYLERAAEQGSRGAERRAKRLKEKM